MAKTPAPASDREIVHTRLLDAPRDLVFRVFTEPQHVVHWWGPFGFRNTIHEMAVKPGGFWRLTMHGPDGTDYPNELRYHEVVRPERLVYSHGTGVPGDTNTFDGTITFEEQGGKTLVTLRVTFSSVEQATEAKKYAVEGGRQTMTRLEGYVGTMRERALAAVLEGVPAGSGAGEDDFVIARVFEAPRELLFKVITEPSHLGHWFGPAGMGLRVVSSELRPGGEFRYAMKAGPSEMFGRFVYREITPPSRLAYVVSFTDERGVPVRHPLSKSWPLEVLAISTLVAAGEKTLYFGRSFPIHATEEERQTFRGGHQSMVQGFGGTYNQLDEYLKTLR